ncbi:MAG: ion transporter [Lachnospiraceae bacterium]|nr:ion transporter [Lachnospiraceae bacterium]
MKSIKQRFSEWKVLRKLSGGRDRGKYTKQFFSMFMKYFAIAGAILLVYVFLLFLLVQVEKNAEGTSIRTMGQALWYSLVTFTTVGYGDIAPVTPAGRLIASVFLLIGIGLLGFFIGFMAEFFTRMRPVFILAMSTDKPWYVFTAKSSHSMIFAENLKAIRPNALIVYAETDEPKKTSKDISVLWSVREILERRGSLFDAHILCMKENEMENFLDSVDLADIGVSTICLANFTPAYHPININFFSLTDCTARVFWQQFPIKKTKEIILIIGFGTAGKVILDRALELNVIHKDQAICYHIFGDGSEYCRNRKHLDDFVSLNKTSATMDSVIFHDQPWNHDETLIGEADRIILCADSEWENLENLHTIQKFFAMKGELYIYNSNVRGVATSFGRARELLTPAFVLHNCLSDMALCRHELFRFYHGGNVPLWENLNSLTKDENYITTDHTSVKTRILLGAEAPDRPFDEISSDILQRAQDAFNALSEEERGNLCRLEHERILRFYKLHNFSFGEEINEEKRINPMIRPYDELNENERRITEIGWLLLGELASHKKAKGR